MKFLIPFRTNEKWGFSNSSKEIKIPCIYDDVIIPFSEENYELSLVKLNNKFFWINNVGNQISPPADSVMPFTPKGISVIILDKANYDNIKSLDNCLFIDYYGMPVFKIEAITCGGYQGGTCIVYFPNKKYGAIDSKGDIVIAPEFDEYEAIWDKIGRSHFYDTNKKVMPEPELKKITVNGIIGFKNLADKVVIEPKYKHAHDFYEGIAGVAEKDKEFHHINTEAERLYPQNYYFVDNFYYDIAKVVTTQLEINPTVHMRWGVDYYIPEEAKWGYIDKRGNEYWKD